MMKSIVNKKIEAGVSEVEINGYPVGHIYLGKQTFDVDIHRIKKFTMETDEIEIEDRLGDVKTVKIISIKAINEDDKQIAITFFFKEEM